MVDLINQIDFKREIANQNHSILPQNIQAIKLIITSTEIISLSIDTRLIVNRKDFRVTAEDLKSRKLQDSTQLYSAFLGFIDVKSVIFVLLVDRCSHHQLHPLYRDFFHIHSTTFIALDNRAAQNSEVQEAVQNLKQLLSKGFYFTFEKCDDIDKDEFMWNRGLCKQIYAQQIKNWDVLMIQGFMDSFSVYLEGKRVQVALIAKRSFRAPGTRQQQTGVQKDGSVANFVETTQIVAVANIKCSFRQVRGSVPVFWKESGNLLMKKLELSGNEQENHSAFENHFNRLVQKYERVLAVNLMNQKKQIEHDLIQAYEIGIQQYPQERVRYLYYNFDEITQGVDFHVINNGIMKISDLIKNFQFDAVDIVNKQRYLKQKGIVRTNCLACLDRTNVYQSRIGLLMLEYQLKCMSLDLEKILGLKVLEINENHHKQVNPIILLFKQLWADHGDFISYHYTGTGSLHTNQDRVGQQSFLSILGSGMVPLSRFYRNNFSEHLRQESILTLLGNSQQVYQQPLIDHDQSYLTFTGLDQSDLQRLGYSNLYFKKCKQSEDGSKYTIFAVNDEQNIIIQCFGNMPNKFFETANILKDLEKKIDSGIKIRKVESKLAFVVELGTLNLFQLTKNESHSFTEQQLFQILLEMAVKMNSYSKQDLFMNGVTASSVWFQYVNNKKYQLYFDTITNTPTAFSEYPTIIKPDYMDPVIIQKIDQQEKALEQQESISNTNDLIADSMNNFALEQVQAAQVWILGRIIYVIVFYPQPSRSNDINIMLPYLNQMIEKQKFATLAQLLKRMFRVGIQQPILTIDELINEIETIIPTLEQGPPLLITDKSIKEEKFQEKELRAQIDLCKHFRCYEQGLKATLQLQETIQDTQLEDKIQQVANKLFFLIYLGRVNDAFEEMIEFLQLLDQCSEPEVMTLKGTIIDVNLLFLRCFQEFQQFNFSVSQLKEIALEEPPANFNHTLKSIIYLIWSQVTLDEDNSLSYALKAQEFYRGCKVQHEYLKILIHLQIIQIYARKEQGTKIQEYIKNALNIIIGDTMEKHKLLTIQAKIELDMTNTTAAIELYEKAIKCGQKVYKDQKYPALEQLRQTLAQLHSQ